jgi:hypothetical protein
VRLVNSVEVEETAVTFVAADFEELKALSMMRNRKTKLGCDLLFLSIASPSRRPTRGYDLDMTQRLQTRFVYLHMYNVHTLQVFSL